MEKATFNDHGRDINGIYLANKEVFDILGHDHTGTPEDDHAIESAIEFEGYSIDHTEAGLATEDGFYYPII